MSLDPQKIIKSISKNSTEVSVDTKEITKSLDQTKNDTIYAIEAKEKGDILKMRRLWSKWLLGLIVFIVLFDSFIIIGLGFNIIQFTAEYLVPAFIVENLVKVFGLAYIVVNFLFPNEDNV